MNKEDKQLEELAAKIVNDYVEGIDGGESRETLRKIANFYSMESHYCYQDFRRMKDTMMLAEIGIKAVLPVLRGDRSKEAKAIRKIFKFVTDDCERLRKELKK